MIADLILLWMAAIPLMGSPGPATLSSAAMGAAYGFRGGLGYAAGVMAGTFSVLLLIASGITGMLLAVPGMVPFLTVLGGAYILYLAYRIATAPVLSETSGSQRQPSFVGGYVLAIANPKAFAAIGAVYAGHVLVEGDLWRDAVAKVAALSLIIVLANSTWLALGSALSRILRDPRKGRIANIGFAVLLVVSVAMAFLPM